MQEFLSLRLTQHSLESFTHLILMCAIASVLVRTKVKSIAVRYLVAYFLVSVAFELCAFTYFSFNTHWQVFCGAIQYIFVALAQVLMLFFAYHFPTNTRPRESRIVAGITTFMLLGTTVLCGLYIYQRVFSLINDIQLLYVPGAVVLLCSLWTIIVFFRNTFIFAATELPNASSNVLSIASGWKRALLSEHPRAKGSRHFAYVLISVVLLSLVTVLRDADVISPITASVIQSNGILLYLFSFAVVYLNHATSTTSVSTKILLTVLAMLLSILGTTGFIAISFSENALIERQKQRVEIIRSLILNANTSEPATLQRYTAAYADVTYIMRRSSPDDTTGTLLYKTDTHLEASHLHPRNTRPIDTEKSMHYADLISNNKVMYFVYPFVLNGAIYEAGFRYDILRAELHSKTLVFLGLIIFATALVLVGIPYFLRSNVLKPLQTLLTGVQYANEGNLNITVPVWHQDEIGFLSDSFNQMIASIKTNERERHEWLEQQNESLEREVLFRTQELQDRNDSLFEANARIQNQIGELDKQSQEIQRVNETLNERNTALEQLNTEQKDLLNIVAHDLKNPIANIRILAQFMIEPHDHLEPSEIREHSSRIVKISDRMFMLIKDILDMNAVEHGRITLTPKAFKLQKVVNAVVEEQEIYAASKNITLHIKNSPAPVHVYADESATQQVLANLVSNAVKYSPRGRSVFVSIDNSDDGRQTTKTTCILRVRDEGPGLSDEDKKKLFGKFAQLSARPTGGEHSTGLGLSIVKRLVEAMNGRIWCESEFGAGATFVVELPAVGNATSSVQEQQD